MDAIEKAAEVLRHYVDPEVRDTVAADALATQQALRAAQALAEAGLLAADRGEICAEANSAPRRFMYTCPFCKDWQVDFLVAGHPGGPFIEAVLGEHVLECPSPEAIPAAARAAAHPARTAR